MHIFFGILLGLFFDNNLPICVENLGHEACVLDVWVFYYVMLLIVMVALCNRANHNIFMLWFVLSFFLSFFSSPNLSRRRLDVCHTSTHGVALV